MPRRQLSRQPNRKRWRDGYSELIDPRGECIQGASTWRCYSAPPVAIPIITRSRRQQLSPPVVGPLRSCRSRPSRLSGVISPKADARPTETWAIGWTVNKRWHLSERGRFWRYALAAVLSSVVAAAVAWIVGSSTRSAEVVVDSWLILLVPAQIVAGYVATPSALRGRKTGIILWGISAAVAHPFGNWLGLMTYMPLSGFGFQLVRDDPQHFTLEAVDAALRTIWLAVWWGFFLFVVWFAWRLFAPRAPAQ